MKHTLLSISFCAFLFASCTQPGEDVASLQKKVDSMAALLNTTQVSDVKMSLTSPEKIIDEPKESYYISWTKSRNDIQRWHKHIWNPDNGLIEDTARCSFIIPATNLRYLVDADSMNMDYVVFYLSLDSAKMLSLIYEGGKITKDKNGQKVMTESPVYTDRNTKYAFDNAYPCPICDKIGLTNSQ